MEFKIAKDITDTIVLDQILELRNNNFKETYNKEIEDIWTEYDSLSYHFLVYSENKIVGCYRLREFNNNTNDTLASSLFNLDYFSYNVFAEISRACVHPEYRDGKVISILWTNISSFLLANNIKYCIGCTSSVNNEVILNNTFSYILKENLVLKDLIIPKNIIKIDEKLDEDEIKKKHVTTLIRAYGKQGALFCPYPSYDKDWNTVDFFTVFNVSDLTKKFSKMG